VSRTFGDIEAKLEKYGGNDKVVVAIPEILEFKLMADLDFIVLGCDGIFDKLSNEDTSECVWKTVQDLKG
jgi:protein phosphatase 2C family protein 2/3